MTNQARPAGHARRDHLKRLLATRDSTFWPALAAASLDNAACDELLFLATLRKKAIRSGWSPESSPAARPLRLALVGGYSFYPLTELLQHLLATHGYAAELWNGAFDNYMSEALDAGSGLYRFQPDVVCVLPSGRRCISTGGTTDDVRREVAQCAAGVLDICRAIHATSGADVILCNYVPPSQYDPGPYRTRTLASEWGFKKSVNLELGLCAPPFVQLCDCEHVAYRIGGEAARDDRAWFESKQVGSPALLAGLAREIAHCVRMFTVPAKKMLILDLDDTLWGGTVGDDGVEGIELGSTSPRGEAFRAFQQYALHLQQRGVLLAVCSKNEPHVAAAPFERHPEMVLRMSHLAAFKASWRSKADAIREIGAELQLALDSMVFVDDAPAEVELVRQCAPDVTGICLGGDPAEFVALLSNRRLFEPRALTEEDSVRTEQYQRERERKVTMATATDMPAYLASLEMTAQISAFTRADGPRISQLINKSNQFNLTTVRRSEGEVVALIADPAYRTMTVRLADRFGDHGLIAIAIARVAADDLIIDTLLVSCRVLNRQVEDELINELVRLARLAGCGRVVGTYVPSAKNMIVANFFAEMAFAPAGERTYAQDVLTYRERPSAIAIERRAYD